MNSVAALLVLAIVAGITFLTRPRRTSAGSTVQPTPDQRKELWRARLDDEIGLKSEEYLQLRARGIAEKKRLLARLRAIERKNREPDLRSVVSPLPSKRLSTPSRARRADPVRRLNTPHVHLVDRSSARSLPPPPCNGHGIEGNSPEPPAPVKVQPAPIPSAKGF